MGIYSQRKREAANDALINAVDSSKFDSLKEILTMLSDEDGKKNFAQLVAVEIEKALGEEGAITTAISGAITTAIGENGAIETWGDERYTKKTE